MGGYGGYGYGGMGYGGYGYGGYGYGTVGVATGGDYHYGAPQTDYYNVGATAGYPGYGVGGVQYTQGAVVGGGYYGVGGTSVSGTVGVASGADYHFGVPHTDFYDVTATQGTVIQG